MNIQGKTIKSFEIIRAEYGRTYDRYMLFTFTDGTKLYCQGNIDPYNPDPEISEMQKAPNFFSPEDIANKMLREERAEREKQRRNLECKKREYERLQKELGLTPADGNEK